eukprot:TRINITY_DN2393_c0_g1_i1.p1 TRINITY_DN2393_c0_g1~~TRINITY_DN2393_c0_g1_i1.p1  ORF type:complete len:382 (-),score=102.50 TRINITY_DN2393_c0_g1_i1:84-1229(-)
MEAPAEQFLNNVGFHKTKVGSDDKEMGYAIKRGNLHRVVGVLALGVTVVSSSLLFWNYEVHIERRSVLSFIRKQARRGDEWASKLAKVETELWTHYQRDIDESEDAKHITRRLNESYELFQSQLHDSVQDVAKEVGMPTEKAVFLASKLMQIVLKHRHDNLRNIEGLVDGLVNAGVKSRALEKHIDHETKEELKESEAEADEIEELLQEASEQAEIEKMASDHTEGGTETLLRRLFDIWEDFEEAYPGPYPALKKDSPLWKRIKKLEDNGDDAETEEELAKLGLEEMKLGFVKDSNPFSQDVHDFVDMLLLVEQIPRQKLQKWRKAFDDKTMPMHIILGKLRSLGSKRLPVSLFAAAVAQEEEQDAKVVTPDQPMLEEYAE